MKEKANLFKIFFIFQVPPQILVMPRSIFPQSYNSRIDKALYFTFKLKVSYTFYTHFILLFTIKMLISA